MLSIPDMAVLGAVALVLFGPDRLPIVARKAGKVMRDVQNTSQSFIREMERAADAHEPSGAVPHTPVHDPYALDLGPPVAAVHEPLLGPEGVPPAPVVAPPEAHVAAHDVRSGSVTPGEPREF